MRFIFGVIVGIALAIGAALLHDNNIPAGNAPPRTTGDAASEAIVDWDALGAVVREDTALLGRWWDNLLGRVAPQAQAPAPAPTAPSPPARQP